MTRLVGWLKCLVRELPTFIESQNEWLEILKVTQGIYPTSEPMMGRPIQALILEIETLFSVCYSLNIDPDYLLPIFSVNGDITT